MPATRLRLYRGPEQPTEGAEPELQSSERKKVTRPAGEVMALLADAYASRRTWLSDFDEDHITISNDLYEVLLAYRFFNRPA
ncbi:hypothetical protein [Aeoliella mucimassa]|uniref:Uncharacterized protein n=1 Tax=Aeoliella mucimassa TaxID=2527972 RepID=A0A518AHQ6_9BACT|nr:hypothetical protein [Aeoliella mucimassa]QDU54256.1 hypothetical protein Pan181_04360 [Aeoliella mucimassa]